MTICAVFPNYNYALYLQDALKAVLNQTYPVSKVIIIDDGSTDGSVEKIEEIIKGRPEVTFIRHEKNQGFYNAVAAGVALADTEFLFIGSTDDCILPNFFEEHMRCFQKEPRIGLSCGTPTLFKGQIPKLMPPEKQDSDIYLPDALADVIRHHPLWISGSTVLYRTKAFKEFGGMRKEAQILNDWILNYQIGFTYGIGYVHQPLSMLRVHSHSMSGTCDRTEAKLFPAFEHVMQELEKRPSCKALFQRSGILNDLGPPIQQYIRKRAHWAFFLPMQMRRIRLKVQRMLIAMALRKPRYVTYRMDLENLS